METTVWWLLIFFSTYVGVEAQASSPHGNLVLGIEPVSGSSINSEIKPRLRPPNPTVTATEPHREGRVPSSISPHLSGIYSANRNRVNNETRETSNRPRVTVHSRPIESATNSNMSRPSSENTSHNHNGTDPTNSDRAPEGDLGSNLTPEHVSLADRGAGIETMGGHQNHTHSNDHNDTVGGPSHHNHNHTTAPRHDHSYAHEHLEKVLVSLPTGLGMNITPMNGDDMHGGDVLDTHDWDLHEGENAGAARRDKSLDDHDLCEYCLCNREHTHVKCEHGYTLSATSNLTLARELIPPKAITIEVVGFQTVTVMPETFSNQDSPLEHLTLKDIHKIELTEHSFHFSPHSRENMRVRIMMVNCNIPVVPSSALTQLEVGSDHTHGRGYEALALEKTRFITLRFLRCSIGEMESHAFYRARLLYFNFTDVKIGSMSQKSIDLDVYEDWIVQDSRLPHLPANAVCLHTEKSVVFSRNLIQELDPHAWAIEAGGQVLFEYNTVEKIRGYAFVMIKPMEDSRSANIVFLNNTVLAGDPNALVISSLYLRHERKVLNNRFNILCECNITVQFQKMLNINPNSSDDQILNEAVLEYSLCAPHIGSRWYVRIGTFMETECAPMPTMLIIISTLVLAILAASVTVAIICAKKAKKAQEEVSYLGETSSRSFSTMNTHAAQLSPSVFDSSKHVFYDSHGNPSWIMAVPELKTYQETEVHVTYEESQPIAPSARNSCQDYMTEMQRKNLTRKSCPFN